MINDLSLKILNVYHTLPLSEHVSSAPHLLHLRWHVCIFAIGKSHLGQITTFSLPT